MDYVLRQEKVKTNEDLAREGIKPGMKLYGYCNGIFGRDSFDDKLVVDVIGKDHIEVQRQDGSTQVVTVKSWMELVISSNEELEKREKYDG